MVQPQRVLQHKARHGLLYLQQLHGATRAQEGGNQVNDKDWKAAVQAAHPECLVADAIETAMYGCIEAAEVLASISTNQQGNPELDVEGSGDFSVTALCRHAPQVDSIQGEWHSRHFEGMLYYLVVKIITLTIEPVGVGDLTAWRVKGRFSWSA